MSGEEESEIERLERWSKEIARSAAGIEGISSLAKRWLELEFENMRLKDKTTMHEELEREIERQEERIAYLENELAQARLRIKDLDKDQGRLDWLIDNIDSQTLVQIEGSARYSLARQAIDEIMALGKLGIPIRGLSVQFRGSL